MAQIHALNTHALFRSDAEMLSHITPETAQWYRFYDLPPESSAQAPPKDDAEHRVVLGPEEAFRELQNRGCRLATAKWVENHWGLILWKLAGMVANDPEPYDALLAKWSWTEVMRQLRYRCSTLFTLYQLLFADF